MLAHRSNPQKRQLDLVSRSSRNAHTRWSTRVRRDIALETLRAGMLGPDGDLHPATPGRRVELWFRADEPGEGLLRLRVGAAGADRGVAGAE